jgi:dihydroorotate dehydrogenase (NAD+) catalytic subunit
MVMLKPGPVEIGGVRLKNHLILAAGILGPTGSSLARVLNSGAGGVVTKSIGPEPAAGHPGPCLAVLEDGVLNAMGLPNPSRDFTAELEAIRGESVIVSVFGGNPDEFAEVASWFAGDAMAFELNVSCPHAEGYGAAIGTDPEMVEECTRAVARLGVPVWVKLTPNVTDITVCGRAAEHGGASAVVAVNTLKAMRISPELRRPILGYGTGGLSGRALFPVALRCVYELYEACSVPIIGCGGVSTPRDAIEMMMAGAGAIEIGSAVLDGIDIFERIAAGLYAPDGETPDGIVGCAHA